MRGPPPPPKGFAPVVKAKKLSTESSSLTMEQLLQNRNLTKVETVVTSLKLKVTNVLLITKFWGCFEWLTTESIKLVLITSKESNEAREEFINDSSNPRFPDSFTLNTQGQNPGGEVEYLAYQLHQKHRFTHVICHTENDLIRAARIREMLGLTSGQSLQNTLRYRDKVLMKNQCQAEGLKVPTFASVEGASDIIAFVTKHGFPVVVKPKLGYSSVDTTVLRNLEDVKNFCKTGLSVQGIDPIYGLEIEKFVNGPMFHIDGLVIDGKVVISWPSKYTGTVMQFKSNQYIAGFSLDPKDPLVNRLNTYVEDVIKALGKDPYPNPPSFPFHAEAWHTPEDEIVLCEIASRGGGGNIKKEITELFKINMDEIWTQALCGDAFPTSFDDNLTKYGEWRNWKPEVDYLVGWIYIYPKAGTVTSFPTFDPSTKTWNPSLPDYCLTLSTWLEIGQKFDGPKDCADTCCAALVKGKSEDDVAQNIQKICDWFYANSVW